MNRISIWLALLICVCAGYLLGFASYKIKPRGSRGLSSTVASVNNYDALSCLSEADYRAHAKALNLEVPDGNSCEHQYHGKLSRVFYLGESLRINIEPNWAPELQPDIKDALLYLRKHDHSFGIDLHMGESTIAYNTSDDKKPNILRGRKNAVMLTALYFKEDPLDALAVLVHEARHSSPNDPAHTVCRMGNIPRAAGGCDRELSIKEGKAGAYSYGAALYAAWSLFAERLSDGDREYLKTASLSMIAARFNILPPELAERYDLIAGLKKDGTVALLHPFVPAVLPGPKFEEKIKRTELYVSSGGLMVYSENNRAFEWGPSRKVNRVLEKYLSNDYRMLELSRVILERGFDAYPYNTFLKENNDIEFLKFNTEKSEYEVLPYKIWRFTIKNPEIPKHKYFFVGMGNETFFLSVEGVLYRTYRYASEPHWVRLANPDGHKWLWGTGGVVSEELYLVSDGGRLFWSEGYYPESNNPDDEVREMDYRILPSKISLPKPIVKLLEGVDLRAVLDRDGKLYVSRYGDELRPLPITEPLQDFAILRPSFAEKVLIQSHKPSEEAEKLCDIAHAIPDPWLQGAIGINSKRQLVFAVPGSEDDSLICLIDDRGTYESVRVSVTADKGKNKNPYDLLSPALELRKTDGTYEIRRPYGGIE